MYNLYERKEERRKNVVMDTNSWSSAQAYTPRQRIYAIEPPIDWRTQLQADSRRRIVYKIMETLKRHLPLSGQDQLKKIAVRLEEKVYTAATSQSDYLRKISLKMLTMEMKSQNTMANPLTSNPATNSKNPPDPDQIVMDTNSSRPAQGGEPPMDAGDWRTQLQPDSRQRIVSNIMLALSRHLPYSGQDGLQELENMAVRIEEEGYTAATSQSDYLRKLSLKMLTVENRAQNTMANPLPSNPAANS